MYSVTDMDMRETMSRPSSKTFIKRDLNTDSSKMI